MSCCNSRCQHCPATVAFHHVPKTGGTFVREVLVNSGVDIRSSHRNYHPSRNPSGYYITWCRHPVDMVYSSWAFFHKSKNPFIFHKGLARVNNYPTLESYVDAVIDGLPAFPRGVHGELLQYKDRFDFIGSAGSMLRDLSALCKELGVEPRIAGANHNSGGVKKLYRRYDLRCAMQKEIEDYLALIH